MISIIVPVFNAEKYLDSCLSSIKEQSYNAFECILVNDGSIDNSPDICKKYCSLDNRFRLINQTNKGSASARNTGLLSARGDYISFIDSDDWIDEDFLFCMHKSITESNCDVAFCDMSIDGSTRMHPNWSSKIVGKENIFSEYLWGGVNNSVVNKLYRKMVVQGHAFPEGIDMMEDASWTPRIMECSNALIRLDVSLYNYRTNPTSLVHKPHDKNKALQSNLNRLDKLEVFFRNITKEEDLSKLSRDALEIFKLVISQTDDKDWVRSGISHRLIKIVNENNVLRKYAVTRSEKSLVNDIILCKPLIVIKRNYARSLLIENIKHKIQNLWS